MQHQVCQVVAYFEYVVKKQEPFQNSLTKTIESQPLPFVLNQLKKKSATSVMSSTHGVEEYEDIITPMYCFKTQVKYRINNQITKSILKLAAHPLAGAGAAAVAGAVAPSVGQRRQAVLLQLNLSHTKACLSMSTVKKQIKNLW